jgi:hypothetical protein
LLPVALLQSCRSKLLEAVSIQNRPKASTPSKVRGISWVLLLSAAESERRGDTGAGMVTL